MNAALLLVLLILMAGCGSADKASIGTAKTSLKTANLPVDAGYTVTGIDFYIKIPDGVGAPSDLNSIVKLIGGTVDPNMIINFIDLVYNEPQKESHIRATFVNATGFKPADVIQIQLGIEKGFNPDKAAFQLNYFKVFETKFATNGAILDQKTIDTVPEMTVEIL